MSYALNPSLVPEAVRLMQTLSADLAPTRKTIPGGPPSYQAVAAILITSGVAVKSLALLKALEYNPEVRKARQKRYDEAEKKLVQRAIKELAKTDSWKQSYKEGISWKALCNRLGMPCGPVITTMLTQNPVLRKAFDEALDRLPMYYRGPDPVRLEKRRQAITDSALEALKNLEWLKGSKPTHGALLKHLGLRLRRSNKVPEGLSKIRVALEAAVEDWERGSSTLATAAKEPKIETLPKALPSQDQDEVPKGPEGNLRKFIGEAKRSAALKGVVWDSWRWNPVDWDSSRNLERAHISKGRLIFSNRETSTGSSSARREKAPMVESYLSFAKADMLLYQQSRDVGMGALSSRLLAHRQLEYAYRHLSLTSVSDLTPNAFFEAEKGIKKMAPATAYMLSCVLVSICDVLDSRGLTRQTIGYQNSLEEPPRIDSLTPEGQAAGELKMLSDPTVEEFAKLSTNPPKDDLDLLAIRITDLLIMTGFRLGEALTLPADTLVRENREIITNPATGEKVKAVGLKYIPEKVNDYRTKPISPSAIPVVERAVNDINRICGPAREVARWMEANPGRLLPLKHLKTNDYIWGDEACKLMGLHETAHQRFTGVPKQVVDYQGPGFTSKRSKFRVEDIERYFLRMCGPRPVMKTPDGKVQLLSESLIVHPQRMTAWRPKPMTSSAYRERMKVLLPGFNSHQARHRLNTLAEFGGLTDIEQMKLMGRNSISQNHVYKHGTAAHQKEALNKAVLNGEVHGSVARIAQNLPVKEREAFIRAVIGYVHIVPFGICIHDFAALPCQEDHQCLGCGDYTRVKGDEESRQNILEARRGAVIALEMASRALVEEPWSKEFAEQHKAAAQNKINGCDAALAIDGLPFESPDPIKVFPHAPSLFKALK